MSVDQPCPRPIRRPRASRVPPPGVAAATSRHALAGPRWAIVLARVMITAGGISTIVAVTTVFLFLLWVVIPLFRSRPGRAREPRQIAVDLGGCPPKSAWTKISATCWALFPDGKLQLIADQHRPRCSTSGSIFDGATLTAASFPVKGTDTEIAFGFDDGSLALRHDRFRRQLCRARNAARPSCERWAPEKAAKFQRRHRPADRAGAVPAARSWSNSWKPAAEGRIHVAGPADRLQHHHQRLGDRRAVRGRQAASGHDPRDRRTS